MLWDVPPLRVGQEELVDSVIVDATIYNPGGPHLGAFPGPLFGAFRHQFHVKMHRAGTLNECNKYVGVRELSLLKIISVAE